MSARCHNRKKGQPVSSVCGSERCFFGGRPAETKGDLQRPRATCRDQGWPAETKGNLQRPRVTCRQQGKPIETMMTCRGQGWHASWPIVATVIWQVSHNSGSLCLEDFILKTTQLVSGVGVGISEICYVLCKNAEVVVVEDAPFIRRLSPSPHAVLAVAIPTSTSRWITGDGWLVEILVTRRPNLN